MSRPEQVGRFNITELDQTEDEIQKFEGKKLRPSARQVELDQIKEKQVEELKQKMFEELQVKYKGNDDLFVKAYQAFLNSLSPNNSPAAINVAAANNNKGGQHGK